MLGYCNGWVLSSWFNCVSNDTWIDVSTLLTMFCHGNLTPKWIEIFLPIQFSCIASLFLEQFHRRNEQEKVKQCQVI